MSNNADDNTQLIPPIDNSTFKTGVNIVASSRKVTLPPINDIQDHQKSLTFLEALPPKFDPSKLSLPIPVDLSKIKKNAINALNKVKFSNFSQNITLLELVDALISDSFWFIVCFFKINNKSLVINQSHSESLKQFNPNLNQSKIENLQSSVKKKEKDDDKDLIEVILKRISCNYFKFFIRVCDMGPTRKNDPVLNAFKDFMSQCVYYSIYLAFPKSRYLFNEEFRNRIVTIFAYLYNGVVTENNFVQLHWELDLGKGNIIDNSVKYKDEVMLKLPDIYELQMLIDKYFNRKKYDKKSKKKKKDDVNHDILNTPLYRLYAEENKFETLNLIKPIKISNRKIVDIYQISKQHSNYVKFAKETLRGVAERRAQYEKEINEKDLLFQSKINEVKQNEHRIKRELADIKIQRAQEYANYCIFLSSK